MTDCRDAIVQEWNRRAPDRKPTALFPLIAQSFDHREIVAAVDVLLTGQLTMGEQVKAFEDEFARLVGAPYAVMVNSGSSANLIAMATLASPARHRHLERDDEVLVPAVCWPTSVWPIVQYGLRPVFVDAEPRTLNADDNDLRRRITPRTKAIVAVHVLGNATPMANLLEVAARHNLMLLEDTCESLGSTYRGRWLGTFGEMGTYSFYYSHHITTGEGGMVVCQTLEDYDLLRSMRAHGWSRDLSNRTTVEQEFSDIDPRFLFIHSGYNLRPLEIQAAFGRCQLQRLAEMNHTRNANRDRLMLALRTHKRWDGRFRFPEPSDGTVPVWFGFPCLLSPAFGPSKTAFLDHLSRSGVENRPIIGGNFTRQPAVRRFGLECDPTSYTGAEEIDRRGYFIGIHTEHIADALIDQLAGILLADVDTSR